MDPAEDLGSQKIWGRVLISDLFVNLNLGDNWGRRNWLIWFRLASKKGVILELY